MSAEKKERRVVGADSIRDAVKPVTNAAGALDCLAWLAQKHTEYIGPALAIALALQTGLERVISALRECPGTYEEPKADDEPQAEAD